MPAPGPSGNFPSGNFPSGPSWNVDPRAVVGGGQPAVQPTWTPNGYAQDYYGGGQNNQVLTQDPSQTNYTTINGVRLTGTNTSGDYNYFTINGVRQPGNITAKQISPFVGTPTGGSVSSSDWYTGPAIQDQPFTPSQPDADAQDQGPTVLDQVVQQQAGGIRGPIVPPGGPNEFWPATKLDPISIQSPVEDPTGLNTGQYQLLNPDTYDPIANNTPTPYGGGPPPVYQPSSEQPPPDYGQPQFDENSSPVDISGQLGPPSERPPPDYGQPQFDENGDPVYQGPGSLPPPFIPGPSTSMPPQFDENGNPVDISGQQPQFDLVPQVSEQEQQYLEPMGAPSEGWPTVGGEPSDFSPVTSLYAPGGKYSAPSDSAYTPSILPQDLSTEAPTAQQFGVPPATEPAVNPDTGQPAPQQQETADTVPADKVDPKDVVIDPNTGELTDSKTGKVVEPNVDPQTGKTSYPFELPQAAPGGPVKEEPIYPIDKGQTEIVPDGQPNEGWPNVPEIQPAPQFPQEQFGPPQNLGPSPPPPDYGQPQFEQPGPPVEIYGPLGPPTLPSPITPLSTQEFPYIQGSPSEQPSTWPTPITPLSTQELHPIPGSPSEQPSTWPTPITPLSTQELHPIPGSPSEQPSSGQFTPPPVQPETPTVAPGQPNEGWPAMPGEQAASTPLPMPRPGAPHPMASPFPNDATPRGFTGVKANVISNVFQAWKSQGASDIAISGILGNIEQESVFDPSLTHPDNHNLQGDRGWSHGLYQENGEEWDKYLAWIELNSPGSNWRDPLLQSQFAAWNLKTNYPKTWAKMNAAKTPEEAAEIYRKEYLRPAESAANQPHRNVSAHDFYTALHPGQAPPAPSPTVSGSAQASSVTSRRYGLPSVPALAVTPGFSPQLASVDRRLLEIGAAAATHMPPGVTVTVSSGFRGGNNQSYHGKGMAIDVHIFVNGQEVPNEGADPTGLYTMWARAAYGEMLARFPELNGRLGWGGGFGTKLGGSGGANATPDLMHLDLGGDRGALRPDRHLATMGPLKFVPAPAPTPAPQPAPAPEPAPVQPTPPSDPMDPAFNPQPEPAPTPTPEPTPAPAPQPTLPPPRPPADVPPPVNIFAKGAARTAKNTITAPAEFAQIDPTWDHVWHGGAGIRSVIAWAQKQTPGAYVLVPGHGYMQLPQAGESVDLGQGTRAEGTYILTMPKKKKG